MSVPIRIKYNEYTATSRCVLEVKYKCSNCGKDISTTHNVEAKASKKTGVYNDGSKFSEALREKASDDLNKKIDRIFKEYKEGKYDAANFDIKCPHCNNKEPWSRLGMSCEGCLILILGALCVSFGLLSFSKPIQSFTFVGIGIGIWSVYGFISSQISKHKYRKIAMLPKDSLPQIYIKPDKTTVRATDKTPSFDQLQGKYTIYNSGHHISGCEYTEISVGQYEYKYYYVYSQMTDRMNAGGYIKQVPESCMVNGKVDTQKLLEYLGYK